LSDRFNIEDCLSFVDNDQKHGLHGHVKIELEHPETKEKTFKFLKTFTQDASLKTNNSYWDEELYDFTKEKLVGNKEKILEYLQKNKIGRMTLRDIYKEYLLSQEFEDGIPNENEGQNYI